MSRSRSIAFVGFVAAGLIGASARADQQAGTPSPLDLKIDRLTGPATGITGQPELTVSSRGVLLSWIERNGAHASLKFSERSGAGWSPVQVAAAGDNFFVNWADVPSVLRLSTGTIAAHWLQKSGTGSSAYDVRLSYSKDDGKTWAAPVTPHHDGSKTEHGFASLFQTAAGGLGLVWLDGRPMAGADHAAMPGMGHGGMSLMYGSFDTSWKQTAEDALDHRVCECCPTSVAMTSEGPIIAYRDRGADETRDIAVSRFENGKWSAPSAVHNDGWKIAACPVNGPRLSARGRDVVAAWFTMINGQSHSLAAFSRDAGRTFGTPIRLDTSGAVGRVDVELLPDGSALASWIESGPPAEFRVKRIESSGRQSAPITVAKLDAGRASGYPRVASANGELVFAWVDVVPAAAGAASTTRILTAAAKLQGTTASQQ